jgi:hypothetical protein
MFDALEINSKKNKDFLLMVVEPGDFKNFSHVTKNKT